MKNYTFLLMLGGLMITSSLYSQKFLYEKKPLILKVNSLEDGLGQFDTDDLPNVTPKNTFTLK